MKRLAFTMVEVCVSMVLVALVAAAGGMAIRKCEPVVKGVMPKVPADHPEMSNCVCTTKLDSVLAAEEMDVFMRFKNWVACYRYCGTNAYPNDVAGSQLIETQVWTTDNPTNQFIYTDGTNQWIGPAYQFLGVMSMTPDGNYWQYNGVMPTNPSAYFKGVDFYEALPAQIK